MGDKGTEYEADGEGADTAAEAGDWNALAYYTASTPEERRRSFIILFVSLVCMGAGQTILFAILPPLSRQLGLTEVQTSSIFGVSALIWVFTSTYWGKKSDLWGRKPVMLIGLLAYAISTLLFASTMAAGLVHWLPAFAVFPLLIASRSIYGTFGSGTSPASQAYVADRTAPAERLQGVATINAAFGMGSAMGPGIAALLAVIGVLAPFYFIVLLALASAGAIWFLLPERTPPKSHKQQQKRTLKWYDPRILPFVLFSVGLGIAGTVAVQTVGFFFIDVLHASNEMAVQYNLIGQMASSMAALFAQLVVVQRFNFSAKQLTTFGLATGFVSFTLFLLAPTFGTLVFAMILSGLGFGVARPGFAAASSLTVSPQEQGAVAGIIGGASAAGFIFGPLIGEMYRWAPQIPYAFGAVLMVGLFIFTRVSRTLRNAGVITPNVDAIEEAEASTPPSV
ncbi:MAG TPA: MFS transporter [Rhizomicrobium sp.]|jgi:MFS family permease|nr:MFS transporter [Rhizomicrobium sp.]